MRKYPFRCKEHPRALIRRTWDEYYLSFSLKPIIKNEKYECSECGKRLAKSMKDSICYEG